MDAQVQARGLGEEDAGEADIGQLVDRLGARIGMKKVYRLAPVQSLVPEAYGTEDSRARATNRVRLAGEPAAADTPSRSA